MRCVLSGNLHGLHRISFAHSRPYGKLIWELFSSPNRMQNSQRVLTICNRSSWQWQKRNRGDKRAGRKVWTVCQSTHGADLCMQWVLEEEDLPSTARGFGTQANTELQAAPHMTLSCG